MAEQEKNGWAEFRQLFLKTVGELDKVKEDVVNIKIEIAVIKFKLFMWGAIGACVGTGAFNLFIWLISKKLTP